MVGASVVIVNDDALCQEPLYNLRYMKDAPTRQSAVFKASQLVSAQMLSSTLFFATTSVNLCSTLFLVQLCPLTILIGCESIYVLISTELP